MPKPIKKGDKINVSVELEFEGTIYNHIIIVENQHISTRNNTIKSKQIKVDGDPITIIGRFRGELGSKIKKYEVKINGYTKKNNNLKLNTGEIETKEVVPYSYFDLIETN